jgi:biopolymer transport protein ExbB
LKNYLRNIEPMNFKNLAIAAAIVVLSAATAGQVLAQTPPAPAMAAPNATNTPAPGAPAAGTPGAPATPAAATPTPPPPVVNAPAAAAAPTTNPYGIASMWNNGSWVIRSVLVLLGIMSAGTWYIFITKYLEQARVLGQARVVERRFWSSNNLNEGIDKLPKNSVFRAVAESGVRAAAGQGQGLVGLNDWIGMSLNRQLDEANAALQGGIAFLASVGSTAPFVGLFGTVVGIINAFKGIETTKATGLSAVAGGISEALVTTALGLLVAVPAVWAYNYFTNKVEAFDVEMDNSSMELVNYFITRRAGGKK